MAALRACQLRRNLAASRDAHTSTHAMGELTYTLRHLSPLQHLLALLFLLGYAAALGSMLGPLARLRSVGIALLAAGGFVAATRPWEHGVLLVLCAVGGVALFIAATWLLGQLDSANQPKPLASVDGRWVAAHATAAIPTAITTVTAVTTGTPPPAAGATALHG